MDDETTFESNADSSLARAWATRSGYDPGVPLVGGTMPRGEEPGAYAGAGRDGPHNVGIAPRDAPRSARYPDTPAAREATDRVWEHLER